MPNICVVRHIFSFQRTNLRFIQSYLHALILNFFHSRQLSFRSSLQPIAYPPAVHNNRSNEQRRATSFTKYYRAIAQNAQDQGAQVTRNEACIQVRRSDERRRATRRLGILRNRSGFSYLGVLILVAVMSITMIGTGRYWSTIVKRELEAELLYRGDRIRQAIASYYNNPPGGQNKTYPRQFSDLLKDPRYPGVKRHLRKWYTDPMNRGKDWVYILDASQRLKGVHSAHEGKPLKTGNFLKDYSEFEQAQTYADWTFVFVPKQ